MKLVAFVGRYGRQTLRDVGGMSVADLSEMAGAIGELLEDEGPRDPLSSHNED